MAEGLLSEILEVECDIRRRISGLEQELQASLAALRLQLEKEQQQEEERCEAECARSVEEAQSVARLEADALLAEAAAYAAWIDSLADAELSPIICRYLATLCPENSHDSPDEQT